MRFFNSCAEAMASIGIDMPETNLSHMGTTPATKDGFTVKIKNYDKNTEYEQHLSPPVPSQEYAFSPPSYVYLIALALLAPAAAFLLIKFSKHPLDGKNRPT